METRSIEMNDSFQVSLETLCARAGVTGSGNHESNWSYVGTTDLLISSIAAACSTQLDFLANFKLHWTSPLFAIPEEWKPVRRPTAWNLQEWMHSAALMSWLQPIDKQMTTLSDTQLATKHDDLSSFAPDFLLRAPKFSVPRSEDDPPFSKNSFYALPFFLEIVTYPGDEDNAAFAIPSFFLTTPGCVLVPKLQLDFPPPLQGTSGSPLEAFGLLMDSFNPSPSPIELMKANLLEPALLVGMKGPSPWPSHVSSRPTSSRIPPTSMDQKVRDLSQMIQSSLDAHLLNWCLRCEQDVQIKVPLPFVSSSALPPCFMIFGILYDADGLVIVAHIPYPTASPAMATTSNCTLSYAYLSCIVDRIPMTGADRPSSFNSSGEPPIRSNLRAALALSALQRHAFMMLTLWERVQWPTAIIDFLSVPSESGESDDGRGSQDYGEVCELSNDGSVDEEKDDSRSYNDIDIDHDHDHDADDGDVDVDDPNENNSESNTGGARDDYVSDGDGSKWESDACAQQDRETRPRDRRGDDDDDKIGNQDDHQEISVNDLECNDNADEDDEHDLKGDDEHNLKGDDEHTSKGDGISYDTVHDAWVDEEKRAGLYANVSRQEQMQTTIPDWLNQVFLN